MKIRKVSKLDQLIKELCPDGVEWKTLGDVGDLLGGLTGKSKDDFNNGNAKFITYMNVFSNSFTDTNTNDFVTINNDENQRKMENGDILFTGSSETLNECGMSSVFVNNKNEDFYLNSFCFVFRLHDKNLLFPDFSKYLFRSENIRKQIIKTANGVTRFNVSKKKMGKIQFPIPPLPVQEEIVRILDNFNENQTALINKLEEELKARKQQYEFYRDTLLTFTDDVEVKTLGEIKTQMYRGSGIKRDQITDTGIPCVRYGEIYTKYNIWFDKCVSHTIEEDIPNKKYFEYGDILFAITGETIEEIAKSCVYLGNEKCLAGGDTVVMKHNEYPKFLSYALSTSDAINQKGKGKVKSKVVHSSVPSLEAIKIHLPSLDEQKRIVKILDNFENKITELTLNLSNEINARKQQYEFYRDQLLTFKDINNESN